MRQAIEPHLCNLGKMGSPTLTIGWAYPGILSEKIPRHHDVLNLSHAAGELQPESDLVHFLELYSKTNIGHHLCYVRKRSNKLGFD